MPPKRGEDQPSRNEDEYFAKQDAELIKQMRANLDEERKTEQRRQHHMKCPKCGHDLKEQARGSVKVDTCDHCGGMWLDAGELDLLRKVEKSGGSNPFKGILDFFPSKGTARK